MTPTDRPLQLAAVIVLAALAPGCTFVKYTEAGAKVRVATADEVVACERVGAASATTKDRILLPRVEDKVKRELDTLACNEAAAIGGDTVVPEGPREKGTQRYIVYRCQ
jgi:hypothetical protein